MIKKLFSVCCFCFSTMLPAQTRTDYAIFFVSATYDNRWTALPYATKEVEDIAKELEKNYGFKIKIVRDATRLKIIETLSEYTQKSYGKKDQLLLFFSMHGIKIPSAGGDKGYLIPKDGKMNNKVNDPAITDSWLSHGQLSEFAQIIPCNRVMLSIDACYSGLFGGSRDDNRPIPAWERPDFQCKERLEQAFNNLRTRKYVTAGGNNRVPAQSVFAAQWVAALKTGGGVDGLLGFHELISNLDQYQEPRPTSGDFEPGASGDFVFVKKDGCADQQKDKLTIKTPVNSEITQSKFVFNDGMVLVKGTSFAMGCSSEQKDCEGDEKPEHQVAVKDFYVGKFEVTQKQWKDVLGSNPSHFSDCEDCPVENVSWEDVQEFISQLNKKTGLKYRLPTEAEWEFAARGGNKKIMFANGKNIADPNAINFDGSIEYKTQYSNSGAHRKSTVPVGSLKSPNSFGLYDMSGNVWEWCADWYHGSYIKAPTNGSAWLAPDRDFRVARGGSWAENAQFVRVSSRCGFKPDDRQKHLGFRLAR